MIVKFSNEYNFEGKKYTEVDLSGLNDLTTMDLMEAQKVMQKSGTLSSVPEMNIAYCHSLAASAANLPIEFFKQLKAKDAIAVRVKVTETFLT